jgi:hypothetical protein
MKKKKVNDKTVNETWCQLLYADANGGFFSRKSLQVDKYRKEVPVAIFNSVRQ